MFIRKRRIASIRMHETMRALMDEFPNVPATEEGDMKPNLTVRDVMSAAPASIAESANAVDAARAMVAENVGSLPVVDSEEKAVIGMITDRDLVLHVIARDLDPHDVSIAEVCSGDPVIARSDESLEDALVRMATEKVRRLPVVDDGRLVGIVAQADIARAATPEATGEMVERISQA